MPLESEEIIVPASVMRKQRHLIAIDPNADEEEKEEGEPPRTLEPASAGDSGSIFGATSRPDDVIRRRRFEWHHRVDVYLALHSFLKTSSLNMS